MDIRKRSFYRRQNQVVESQNTISERSFVPLIVGTGLATFSQGLFIPLIAALQSDRVAPVWNTLGTSITYFGLLLSMLLMNRLTTRTGYKPAAMAGFIGAGVIPLLFLTTSSNLIWTALRLVYGLSLGAIHYSTQTWVSFIAKPAARGRQLALYGFATGVGFALGPLGLRTISFDGSPSSPGLGSSIPFILAALPFVLAMVLFLRLPNPSSPQSSGSSRGLASAPSFRIVYRIAFPALAMPFVYGFLESTLNGELPVLAAGGSLTLGVISLALSLFVLGSLVFQLPLGYFSDRVGRRSVLLRSSAAGAVLFAVMPYTLFRPSLFLTAFFVAGCFVGSLFSLSLAYLNDLVPTHWMPVANQAAVFHFALGMVLGPLSSSLFSGISGRTLFWPFTALFILYLLATRKNPAGKPTGRNAYSEPKN